MKLIYPVFALLASTLCIFAVSSYAQTIYLRDGTTRPAINLRVDGNILHTTVQLAAGVQGDQGFPIAQVDRLELPKPPQINEAEQLVLTGKAAEALVKIEPVITAFAPFREIKGNFWAPATLIKSAALQAQDKRDEAAVLLTPLAKYTVDSTIALTATARLAGILAQTRTKDKIADAVKYSDEIISNPTVADSPLVLGEAWLAKGRALYAQEKYEDALLAYLHLPVFYYDNPATTAQALLGSGRCYLELNDSKKAARAFTDLAEQFPITPEATEAKKEIERGGAPMAKLIKEIQEEKEEAEKKLKDSASNNPA